MDSAVCGQFTIQCVNSEQCSAGGDCLSGAACRANLISTREAAQDRRVQQASYQGSGERVQGHFVTAIARRPPCLLWPAPPSPSQQRTGSCCTAVYSSPPPSSLVRCSFPPPRCPPAPHKDIFLADQTPSSGRIYPRPCIA